MKKAERSHKSDEVSLDAITAPKEVTRELRHSIFTIFNSNPQLSFSAKQLSRRLETTGEEVAVEVCEMALVELLKENVIEPYAEKKGAYRLTRTSHKTAVGTVDMTDRGTAYIIVDDAPAGSKDIIVEQRRTMRAMHGDKVKVGIIGRRRDGRLEGEVVEILAQGKRTFVGRVQRSERFAFIEVDTRQMPFDIFVPYDNLRDAQDGQKVVVEVLDWPANSKNPIGKILDVLGDSGDNNTEMHAILAQYELPYSFPDELEQRAAQISDKIPQEEIAKRRDMRGIPTFTIDPADAKDFDDALSIRKLVNGNWEVGVHIADVTHYVRPGDPIDEEAYNRGTSVYLVDRTVPMLPEKLSNFLCSLRPNEEKLCFSAVFEMTNDAQMIDEWFGRTVILSDRRYAYEEAQAIIEQGLENHDELRDEILTLNHLARQMRAERFRHGSIGFERDEAKFVLDEKGKPLSVYFKQIKESNQLIEEFMLHANRRVAEFIGRNKQGQKAKTFVYRVHDTPNEEKFEKFRSFITRFGYNIKAEKGKAVAKELTKLLGDVKDKPEQNLISTLAIRSMAKAIYTTENIGHYGLAFDYYTHFTSPIRRYPDMMVHRLLQRYLDGGKSADKDTYEEMCEYASAREALAAEAERASIKYKMVEFMTDKIGSQWDGVISGVTDWGIYVEIEENKIEGMVPLRDMQDDFYAFDNETYSVIGHRSGRRFTLGDVVRISIKKADLSRKQLDFEMVGMIDFHSREMTPLPENSTQSPLDESVRFSKPRSKSPRRGDRGEKGDQGSKSSKQKSRDAKNKR